jgi:integrase/recombinase XerC
VRPHGLRHSGITRALELTNGNLREVQKFSRHKNANTIGIYDDNRVDLAGKVTKLLGADV